LNFDEQRQETTNYVRLRQLALKIYNKPEIFIVNFILLLLLPLSALFVVAGKLESWQASGL